LAACQEKATEKQKKRLKCEREWKQCFVDHRRKICKKGVLPYDDEPPPPPSTEEPPPPETEPPTTEEPETSAPVTEKPKRCYCICQWKQCKKTDESVEGQRECFAKLRECVQNRQCKTEVCDTPLAACQEKATEKQKKRLKCERQWKQCFVDHRPKICKKGGHHDEDEPPMSEVPPTEVPETEAPPTEPPSTKKPGKGPKCIGKWKKCKKSAGTVEEKRACYEGLRTCASGHCDTTTCDTALTTCRERATKKAKRNLHCEKQWKRCFKRHRRHMCHKGKGY